MLYVVEVVFELEGNVADVDGGFAVGEREGVVDGVVRTRGSRGMMTSSGPS